MTNVNELVLEYAKSPEGKDGDLAKAVISIAQKNEITETIQLANLIAKRKAFARDFTILSAID